MNASLFQELDRCTDLITHLKHLILEFLKGSKGQDDQLVPGIKHDNVLLDALACKSLFDINIFNLNAIGIFNRIHAGCQNLHALFLEGLL